MDAFAGATVDGGATGALDPAPVRNPAAAARRNAAPDADTTATADAGAAEPAAQPEKRRPRKGAARCETYRTYNAQTKTYRGYDGRIRSCP